MGSHFLNFYFLLFYYFGGTWIISMCLIFI
nr:MAG TPA: hypothetical protein [Bacteriophage sp.]